MSATEIEYQPSNAKSSKFGAKLTAARQYAYNPQESTIFGRTGASWGKIGLFYFVFYALLAGFFAIALMIFFKTMDDHKPNMTGMNSLIKGNPGMSFRPMPRVTSTLIKFQSGEEDSYRKYVDNIKVLLHKYRMEQEEYDYQECTDGRDEDSDLPCKFDLDAELGTDCTEENHFGYYEGRPCILLKLNKIFDWKPKPYSNSTVPEQLPNYSGEGVFVTCEGENFADRDNIRDVQFYPEQGFKTKYFPFSGETGYQAPLVFMKLKDIEWGVVLQITCKAWAKNIYHHNNDKAGSFHMEVLVN